MGEIRNRVFSYIEQHRDELIRYLQEFVRIDTHVLPGRNINMV